MITDNHPKIALELAFSPYSLKQCGMNMDGATVSGDIVFLPAESLETVRHLGSVANLEAVLDMVPGATVTDVASVTRGIVELQKGWTEVTDEVTDVMEQNARLIEGLPNNYDRIFELPAHENDEEAHTSGTRDLTVRKTSDGQLLVSTQAIPGASKDLGDTVGYQEREFIYYALFDSDGKLESTSFSDTPHVIDEEGRVVPYRNSLVSAKNPFNFGKWHQYTPLLREIINRDSEGLPLEDLVGQLAEILTTKKQNPELGSFAAGSVVTLEAVVGDNLHNLLFAREIPRDVIPNKLPSASVYEALNFSGVDKMCDALEKWGVPYVEVEYTAGVRDLNSAIVDRAIQSGVLNSDFDWREDVLPPDFELRVRERNDIYYVQWVKNADGTTTEKRTLLYDGSKYTADLYENYKGSLKLTYPDSQFATLRENPSADECAGDAVKAHAEARHLETQPTTHFIRHVAGYASKGSIVQHDEQGHIIVTVGDRTFDLTAAGFKDDVLQVKTHDYSEGGPAARYRFDRLTLEYHRDADGLLVPIPTAFERRDEMHYLAYKLA